MAEVTYKTCGSRIIWTDTCKSWDEALSRAVELARTKVAQGEWVTVTMAGTIRAKIMGMC